MNKKQQKAIEITLEKYERKLQECESIMCLVFVPSDQLPKYQKAKECYTEMIKDLQSIASLSDKTESDDIDVISGSNKKGEQSSSPS